MYLMDVLQESVPDLVSARKNGFPPVFEGDVNYGDHIKMCDLDYNHHYLQFFPVIAFSCESILLNTFN